MPYAADGMISQVEIEGGIPITEDQYTQALVGMLDGKEVTVSGGFKVEYPEPAITLDVPEVDTGATDVAARLEQLLNEVRILQALIEKE